jgi:4-aminobutyrate aminotransferase-like enzyme
VCAVALKTLEVALRDRLRDTPNNPNVVRIEPPLVLTDEQADRVADAVEAVARANRGVLGATLRVGVRGLRRRSR